MAEHTLYKTLIGTTLGNYRLEQVLEQDNWGPVFRARDKNTTRTCVIRFLSAPLLPSDGTLAVGDEKPGLSPEARILSLGRIQQEANRVAGLQHPNILPLLDFGNYQGVPYLVFPDLSLPSLRTMTTRHGAMDLTTVGIYLDQIVAALEYAHQQGVLHRNLSTRCIFLKEGNQLLVADFGVMYMRELGRDSNAPYDGSGESCTPEQLLHRPVTAATDVYALGAVLYRLLTGHLVFNGNTREQIERQHLYDRAPSLSLWRRGMPAKLDEVLAKAMAKEPTERFQRPAEVVHAYHQLIAPNAALNQPPIAPAVAATPPLANNTPTAHKSSVSVAGQSLFKAQRVSRRQLFTLLAAGGGIGVIAVAALVGIHQLSGTTAVGITVTQGAITGQKVLARVADIPVNSAQTFPLAGKNNPGVLVHLDNNNFVAFDSTCTHAGCAVKYNPQDKLLECPCHGATFDPAKNGAVVQGPAQNALAPVKITVNADGTITDS